MPLFSLADARRRVCRLLIFSTMFNPRKEKMEKKLKKIMFNDNYGLTKAVLEGRKTQTRRMLNPTMLFQRLKTYEGWSNEDIRAWKRSCNRRLYEAQGDILQQMLDYALSSSHYKVGEEVSVAQSYKEICYSPSVQETIENELCMSVEDSAGWNNKMFVRADLMRYRIKITNVRVERLQDISDNDCLKEGVEVIINKNGDKVFSLYTGGCYTTAKIAFSSLMDKICGKATWQRNPFVFVYDFELIR